MKTAPLSQLENRIIRPGFEKHLRPLLFYKGNQNLGRLHRLWNFTVAAMEQECQTVADMTQRLSGSEVYSHLLGPDKPVVNSSLIGFYSRLLDNPRVTDELPGLRDYVRSLGLRTFRYERVPEYSSRRDCAPWRTYRPPVRKHSLPADRTPLAYPFMIHDGGRPEHDLLRKILAAVPKGLPPDMKADVCQDLAVGILCGDFDVNDLQLPAKEMMARVRKMFPAKWGPLSLDALIPGTDDLRLIDTI